MVARHPLLDPVAHVVHVGVRPLLEHVQVVARRVPHAHHVRLAVVEAERVEERRERRDAQRLLGVRADGGAVAARLHRERRWEERWEERWEKRWEGRWEERWEEKWEERGEEMRRER